MSESTNTPSFTVPPDVIARRVGDSAVLVRLSTNKIYELNATGARIWDLLTGGKGRDEVIATLETEFDASHDELVTAFDELIASLRTEGLV